MPEVKTPIKYATGEQGRTLQHYDLEPGIFELFLDPYMKYTCGLYPSGHESLAEAQLLKMEFIAQQLGLSGGEQVLDVGCGWGSLLLFLAQRLSCQGWGVTPAPQQVEYIHRRALEWNLAQHIRVDQAHIQDLHLPAATFDAITFVGCISHIHDKQGMLEECYRLLKPKGRVYISESCFRNRQKYQEFSESPGMRFVREEVFGWGSLEPLSVILSALEDANFSLSALSDLTSHYHRTIQAWMRNIQENWASLEAIHPGIADKLLRYLELSNVGWGFTTKHYAVVATKKTLEKTIQLISQRGIAAMRLSQGKITELVERHTRVADNITWNRFTSIPWKELKPELLTQKERSAIAFINCIEDHLPGYFAEYIKLFPINEDTPLDACMYNRELYHFLVRWAQEEDRHAHVLTSYQLRAGLMSAELNQNLAREGRKQFTIKFREPLQVFTYALLQEKATLLYYKQLHEVIQEPVLKFILRLLVKDEARHFAFFTSVVGAYIEQFGEQVIPHIKVVVEDFKMPLHDTLTDYWRWALVTCDAVGGHHYTEAFEEIVRVIDKFADVSTRSKAVGIVDLIQKVCPT